MTATATTQPTVRLGDRVLIESTIMGKTGEIEVVVVQIDEDGDKGLQIIGRPEGTLTMAFARYEWKPVSR